MRNNFVQKLPNNNTNLLFGQNEWGAYRYTDTFVVYADKTYNANFNEGKMEVSGDFSTLHKITGSVTGNEQVWDGKNWITQKIK